MRSLKILTLFSDTIYIISDSGRHQVFCRSVLWYHDSFSLGHWYTLVLMICICQRVLWYIRCHLTSYAWFSKAQSTVTHSDVMRGSLTNWGHRLTFWWAIVSWVHYNRIVQVGGQFCISYWRCHLLGPSMLVKSAIPNSFSEIAFIN